MTQSPTLLPLFIDLKSELIAAGFGEEIEWQRNVEFADFTESDLLREHAWVALCSGFRESAVRKVFGFISLCFGDWKHAQDILEFREICVETAATAFANRAKLNAIVSVAETVCDVGFEDLKQQIEQDPINRLSKLPFIGPITSYHLAKNLGLSVAKPDRHLVRLANAYGYSDVFEMCEEVALAAGEPIKVVDVVFWRAAALGRISALAA